ncbi:DUF4440 domain-containing protein [Pantoea sp. SGAir0215]
MQMLHIVPRLMTAVRAGNKRHTIRWQEQAITPGPLRYINHEDPADSVIVTVERVVMMPLSSVAQHLGKDEEWPDAELLAGMQEHYPAIQLDSQVAVIHHSAPFETETGRYQTLLAALTALECSLHQEKRYDAAWLAQRLHPEFQEITRSGVRVNRAQTIAALQAEAHAPAIVSRDFQLIQTGTHHALLLYRTARPDGRHAAWRSSHWVYHATQGWQMIFHQASPAAEPDF